MPSPWQSRPGVGGFAIPKPEHRGMTIKQLRSLTLLLQRLCKASLLKRKDGKPVQWPELNMYDINDCVLQELIPKLDPGSQKSYMETMSSEQQPPTFHFCHFWGGKFRDFMAVVEHLVIDYNLSALVAVWICTFANSQFDTFLGESLCECPFKKATDLASKGTVMLVDRFAGSLRRSWCGLELHFAAEEEKPLLLYTPNGKVGSSRVKSGTLVSEIETWDMRRCMASDEADRRQIFNLVAGKTGASENEGLKKRADGTLELTANRRKQLATANFTEDWKRFAQAKGCSPEALQWTDVGAADIEKYEYEQEMMRSCSAQFDELNDAVRKKVFLAVGNVSERHGLDLDQVPPEHRGVTLMQMRQLWRELNTSSELGDLDPGQATWEQVLNSYIIPTTAAKQCSYMEFVATAAQRPRYIVSFARHMRMSDIMQSLQWISDARTLKEDTVIWVFELANNFHRPFDPLPPRIADHLLVKVVSDCDGIFFLCVNDVSTIELALRMLQLHLCYSQAKSVDMGCTSGALACSTPFPTGGMEFGSFDPEIAQALIKSTVHKCQARSDEQAEQIKDYIVEVARSHSRQEAFDTFDSRINRAAAGPVLRVAALNDDVGEVDRLCRIPGLALNSQSLKGYLCETAVHVAAAAGSQNALRCLLEKKADPNAEDGIRETPLHYTALAGKAACTRLLLEFGANPLIESSYAQTPLDVAVENVAFFLGVDNSDVIRVLTEAAVGAASLRWPGGGGMDYQVLMDAFQRHDRSGKKLIDRTLMEQFLDKIASADGRQGVAPGIFSELLDGATKEGNLVHYEELLKMLYC